MVRFSAAAKMRPHQVRAVAATLAHFEFGGRATVVLPGGAGKTVVGAAVVAAVRGRVSVVAAPTLALVDQTLRAYKAWVPDAARRALVVSSRSSASSSRLDRARRTRRTTKAGAIAHFLREGAAAGEATVVFTTYKSLAAVAEGLRRAEERAAVAVFDEAHETTYGGDRGGGALATAPALDAARRLFLTATPRTRTGAFSGAATARRSMDDAALYGPVVSRLSASEAAEAGVTVPLSVIVMDVGDYDRPSRNETALASTSSTSASESITGKDGRPGISSSPSPSLKSNSFSMILEPLILASRVLDD